MLTNKQVEVLVYVREHFESFGMPPTYKNIADRFHYKSANAALELVRRLEKKGYIKRSRGKSRSIVLEKDEMGQEYPLSKRESESFQDPAHICCKGVLSDARICPVIKGFSLPASFFLDGADYLLEVDTMALKGFGVMLGDYLAVKAVDEIVTGVCLYCEEEEYILSRTPISYGEVRGVVTGVFRAGIQD